MKPTQPNQNQDQHDAVNQRLRQHLKTWRYVTCDDQVQWLLAPDSEAAAWLAAELSGGSHNLKDVCLDDNEW